MKKILLSIAVLASLSFVYQLSSNNTKYEAYANEAGSAGGYSSSVSDGQSCFYCHTGSTPNAGGGMASILSTSLANGYIPGQTYTITVLITNTGSTKIGFEVSAEETTNNTKVGNIVITDASRTKLTNSSSAITHQLAGTPAISGSNSWQFDWVAPVAGTGEVTFYGSFNSSNANSHPLGDEIYTTTYTVQEDLSSAISELKAGNTLIVYPNPFKDVLQLDLNEDIDKIEIFSIDGRVVYSSINEKTISTSSLPAGVYYLSVNTKSSHYINKIVKK